jgi:molecular chaperone GrpE
MNVPESIFSADATERLVGEFRALLDEAEGQPEACGTSADEMIDGIVPAVDLATLLAEMAVLKNELRLQSRQFKNTLDELRRFGSDLREHSERLQRELDRAREQSAALQGQTERQFLLALLDLRDRLQSGVDAAQRRPSFLLQRLLPGPGKFAASLAEGQRLTLQRLDELLASHRVRPMRVLGEALDPARMRVVGVEAADASSVALEGAVLREVQRGYFHDGEVLRIAEVIVNKKADRKKAESK